MIHHDPGHALGFLQVPPRNPSVASQGQSQGPFFSNGLRGNPQSLGCGNSDRGFVSAQDGGMEHWTPMALPISENMKNMTELHLKEHEITNYSFSIFSGCLSIVVILKLYIYIYLPNPNHSMLEVPKGLALLLCGLSGWKPSRPLAKWHILVPKSSYDRANVAIHI